MSRQAAVDTARVSRLTLRIGGKIIDFLKYSSFAIASLVFALASEANALSLKVVPGGCFTSIYILVVDPNEYEIIPVKAFNEKYGRETVLALSQQNGAIAAINGGFWQADGRPAGVLKINDLFYGTSRKLRGAIGWSFGGSEVAIDRIRTQYSGSQIEVFPENESSYQKWNHFENIVGGAPLLVKDGLIVDFGPEKILSTFLTRNYARTAVGIRETGEWIFVVVDSRFFLFGGMTVCKLAELMLQLGCQEALNLDGGGSSTMVYNGRVINAPVGKRREIGKRMEVVSDAILILPLNTEKINDKNDITIGTINIRRTIIGPYGRSPIC